MNKMVYKTHKFKMMLKKLQNQQQMKWFKQKKWFKQNKWYKQKLRKKYLKVHQQEILKKLLNKLQQMRQKIIWRNQLMDKQIMKNLNRILVKIQQIQNKLKMINNKTLLIQLKMLLIQLMIMKIPSKKMKKMRKIKMINLIMNNKIKEKKIMKILIKDRQKMDQRTILALQNV